MVAVDSLSVSGQAPMIKQMVCLVNCRSRGNPPWIGFRKNWNFDIQIRKYELVVVSNKSGTKKYPAWKLLETVTSNYYTSREYSKSVAIKYATYHAKELVNSNSSVLFFGYYPSKYARRNELLKALGFDDGTPNFVIKDRLLELNLEITNIWGDGRTQ